MITVSYNQKYNQPIVLAMGFFDCMHLGHKKLVDKAKEIALQRGAQTAVFTFYNNHFKTLGKAEKLLFTFEERKILFQKVGVDVTVGATFDKQFMTMDGNSFLSILKNTFEICAVVVGFDYTCGSDRRDCNFVKDFFASRSIETHVIDQVSFEDEKISSTRIRKLLVSNLHNANSLMANNYFIIGTVEKGRTCGRTIGFPTANVQVDCDKLLPVGVFTADVLVDNKNYKAIVNIGGQPTFGLDKVVVEAHLKDFSGDLYSQTLTITPKKYIRNVVKFENKQQLIEQLRQDLEKLND